MIYTQLKLWYRSLLVVVTFVVMFSSPARAQGWADANTGMTVDEHLQLIFELKMGRPESDSLNSFSLVSFYPSSDSHSAMVLVIQTWRNERIPHQDLRREIRKVGDALTNQFEAMARHPLVLKRWKMDNPKANLIVRHVRLSDVRETLAVTVGGQTLFDTDEISAAKTDVIRRGGVWSW